MAEFKPVLRLPFTSFPGIDSEAGRRIWRDFEELIRNLNMTGDFFDAIVDPTLTANSPGTHEYKTIGGAVNSEETLRNRRNLIIGVRMTATTITETASLNIGSGGQYAIMSLGGSTSRSQGPVWDLNGASFIDNGSGAASVYVRGLTIKDSTTRSRSITRAVGS